MHPCCERAASSRSFLSPCEPRVCMFEGLHFESVFALALPGGEAGSTDGIELSPCARLDRRVKGQSPETLWGGGSRLLRSRGSGRGEKKIGPLRPVCCRSWIWLRGCAFGTRRRRPIHIHHTHPRCRYAAAESDNTPLKSTNVATYDLRSIRRHSWPAGHRKWHSSTGYAIRGTDISRIEHPNNQGCRRR